MENDGLDDFRTGDQAALGRAIMGVGATGIVSMLALLVASTVGLL